MDRYEVMAGKMAPLTDGAHRKWGFTGNRTYALLVKEDLHLPKAGMI